MRRYLIPLALLGLLFPTSSSAAETGTIKGRVLNVTTGEPQDGVEVTLTSGGSGESLASEVATTGPDGGYRFEDLPAGEDIVYALDASHGGGLFAGRAISIPDDTARRPVIDTTLRVWDTTDDPTSILIESDVMFLVPNEEGTVGVIEAVTILNRSEDQAYIGRSLGEDEESRTSLGFALPNGGRENEVSILESDLSVPQLLRKEYGFGITTAIPPGEHKFTFSYELDGNAGTFDLSRDTLYPTVEAQFFAQSPLELEGLLIEKDEEVSIEGASYTKYRTTGGLDGGDPQQILAVAEAGVSPALLAGMAGALALVAALGFIPVWRSRKNRERAGGAPPPPEDPRDALLKRIAELDARHDNGELDYDEWSSRRAAMKEELVAMIEKDRP